MITQTITHSPSLQIACQSFLDEIQDWTQECMAAYVNEPATDVHDQGTYTTGWVPYIAICEDADALAFMKKIRDQTHAHFHESGQWQHGYWKMQEAHHGTEHFELFLGSLYQLDPDDGDTIAQFVDAAEHMGNWEASVAPWFDWETGLYYSMWFGADGIAKKPGSDLNVPDHFRCANICLLAYEMTNERRYLDLATTMVGRWAQAIVAPASGEAALPIGITQVGSIYDFETKTDAGESYFQFAGQASRPNSEVERAENFLASNGVDTFLTLWKHTKDDQFLLAAERLLDVIATQLHDPDAGPAADVILRYRQTTGKPRYDQQVLAQVQAFDLTPIQVISMEPTPKRSSKPAGIGKRQDMPNWFEDGKPRVKNPILLAAAAQVTEDAGLADQLATQSVDLARTYFQLGRQAYPHGRHHGCSAQSVSAISRGHGRDNNAGMVTAVLEPIYRWLG